LSVVTQRRLELAGKPGIRALLSNMHTLSIAVFASIGGLVYGYNQGKSTKPSTHPHPLFISVIDRHVWPSPLYAEFCLSVWRDWDPESDPVRSFDLDPRAWRLGRCSGKWNFSRSTWSKALRRRRLLFLLRWSHCPDMHARGLVQLHPWRSVRHRPRSRVTIYDSTTL
jgi:hypothetical protein